MDPFNKKKSTNRPSRRASNRSKRNMRYPDIAFADRGVDRIKTTYSNMPSGGNKKDSVSYKQGFDAGKVRLSEGHTAPGGYLGPQAVESHFRQKRDKHYGAGYKAGVRSRFNFLKNKDINKRKRNK